MNFFALLFGSVCNLQCVASILYIFLFDISHTNKLATLSQEILGTAGF